MAIILNVCSHCLQDLRVDFMNKLMYINTFSFRELEGSKPCLNMLGYTVCVHIQYKMVSHFGC